MTTGTFDTSSAVPTQGEINIAGRVAEILDGLEGTVGLAALHFGTGQRLEYNGDEVFPTASTFKVPLLYALIRLSEAGELDLDERQTIERKMWVPGSGVLQDLSPGLNPTLRDLAVLMTIVSDNTATDLVYRAVGRERLAKIVAEMGMNATHLPRDCKGLLAPIAGFEPDDPAATYEAIDVGLDRSEPIPGCVSYASDPRNNISTPNDMVWMMQVIEEAQGISAEGREAILDIMKRQKYRTRIPLLLPDEAEVANKTGGLAGICNDVGIVSGSVGRYAIATFSKELSDTVDGSYRIARLSRLVWDTFVAAQNDAVSSSAP